MLAWQVELGATEAICDAPVNRYEVPAAVEKPKAQKGKSGPVPLAAQGRDGGRQRGRAVGFSRIWRDGVGDARWP